LPAWVPPSPSFSLSYPSSSPSLPVANCLDISEDNSSLGWNYVGRITNGRIYTKKAIGSDLSVILSTGFFFSTYNYRS
jgi:hypothetical protein